jgi:glycosyltransferase involved in cell wall biosynthesis
MSDAFRETDTAVKSLSMTRFQTMVHRAWRQDIERLLGVELDGRCLVHSQGIRGDVISSRRLAGLPRVATARNYPYHDYVMKYGPLLGRWMAWSHLRAFRALPVVVACSATLSKMLRQHGLATTVIRNGVDTSKFCAAPAGERTRLRMELGLAADTRVGVCVGALAARKESLSIVQAVRAIDDPALMMIFVGSGTLEAACRRGAQGDARIRFAGQVPDVDRFLRAADFFVSASRSEGLPNAALEAIACGLYAVLSDIGPHRELLQLIPGAGGLFATGDEHALVAAIIRAASHATERAGQAPDGMTELFGAERMSQRYQELYLRQARDGAPS